MIDIYLLPGLDGTGALFDIFVECHPKWARPIPVSYESVDLNTYQALTEFVETKIDRTRPYILIGESFSGPIATLLAHRGGDSLKGLVLSASFISCPSALNAIPLPRVLLEMGVSMMSHHYLVSWFLLNGVENEELVERVMSVARALPNEVIVDRLVAVRNVNVKAELAETRCPVLYLHGKHDRVVPAAACQDVVAANPATQVIEIDSPHMILQCRPNEAWQAISELVEKGAD